jgi:hypothetical protein
VSDIILVHLDALKSTAMITIVQYSMMGVVDVMILLQVLFHMMGSILMNYLQH